MCVASRDCCVITPVSENCVSVHYLPMLGLDVDGSREGKGPSVLRKEYLKRESDRILAVVIVHTCKLQGAIASSHTS